MKEQILSQITSNYLESHDFNGTPVRKYIDQGLKETELKEILSGLIEDGLISLNFGDRHPNPHIKALPEEAKDIQKSKLTKSELFHVCAYPTKKHLLTVIKEADYQKNPFTYRLVLGEPQLKFLSFDLSVLEFYRNDPRYRYFNDDIEGSIVISDDFYGKVPDSDGIVLETFGFSYDDKYNRAVAVMLRYLSDLSSEHQQIWNAKLLEDKYKLHPDYARRISGEWGEGISIFDAFIEELFHINNMCDLMNRPHLFRSDFKNEKPISFSFLIRPTLKEFNDFILLLDKIISDNINKDFFQKEVPDEIEQIRKDGKIVVSYKNTLTLLDEWLAIKLIVKDRKDIEEMINSFKKIRRIRQQPAHEINENVFNQDYFQKQREIIVKAYKGKGI